MIRSMTGYSKVRKDEADFSLSVTVKSGNHRFLDLQVRVPAGLEVLESLVRRMVKDYVARGHVEVTIGLERKGSAELGLDRRLIEAYAAACRRLREEFGFTAPPDPVSLLRISGMVVAGNGEIPTQDFERIQQLLERVLGETLVQLNEMRAREGQALERDLRNRLERLGTLTEDVDKLAQPVPQFYKRRLESRIQELLGSLVTKELDGARLAQEVAYLAVRSDIAEELTRFRSHLEQATHLLNRGPGSEVGKKLDFLLQEMNREANTLLSKTTDVPEVGVEIARQAIEMKAEIEKLREQAQNIE